MRIAKALRRCREDRGYAVALVALLLIPLMAFTGFAVDLGAWQARGRTLQQVADAAALAGVVELPDQGDAEDVAVETLRRNGIVDGDGYRIVTGDVCEDPGDSDGIVVCIAYPTERRMRVMVNDLTVDQYFSSLFVDDVTVGRGATSEFIEPVPMGTPSAILGNDPEAGWAKDFRINTAGQDQAKQNGDKRTAGNCSGSSAGCTAGNTDYSEDGYFFGVKVDATKAVTEPLSIEVFDPAMVQTGDRCTDPQLSVGQVNNLAKNVFPNDDPIGNDWAAGGANAVWRYAPYTNGGFWSTWRSNNGLTAAQTQWLRTRAEMACTGDHRISGGNNFDDLSHTTYIVRAPDDTPFDPTDNDPVCSITFDPVAGGDVYNYLTQTFVDRGTEDMPFYQHYRRWFPICEIPTSQISAAQSLLGPIGEDPEWVVQVRTNADLSNVPKVTSANPAASFGTVLNASPTDRDDYGHTRYAMRAAWGSAPTVNSALDNPTRDTQTDLGDGDDDFISSPVFDGISLSALGHLPIYVNKDDASATFYLARILEANAGRTLRLTFWDMADIGSASANVDVIMPPSVSESDLGGGCDTYRFTDASGLDDTPPGVSTGTGSDPAGAYCYVDGITSANYNGRDVVVDIPIPGDYTCDETDALDCWIKVRITFSSGATASDTTTWSATMQGDPVRLVD